MIQIVGIRKKYSLRWRVRARMPTISELYASAVAKLGIGLWLPLVSLTIINILACVEIEP